nr:DUF6210 family protein [Deinococcus arboris]
MAYIFLDPDGAEGSGAAVVVQAPTGVTYASQVGGHANEARSVEGFAVPVFTPQHVQALVRMFGRYHGNPPYPGTPFNGWTEKDLNDLSDIVAQIPLWRTTRASDERAFLAFDRTRLDELTEAWMPVLTAYGPGILIHENCD